MKNLVLILLSSAPFLFVQCSNTPPDNPNHHEAFEASLREADAAWSKVAQSNQSIEFTSFFLDDAKVLAPNQPTRTGLQEISKMNSEMFSLPGFSLQWVATDVVVSESGDMGYTMGTYTMSWNNSEAIPVTDKGKYLTLWKKQEDGTWKVAVDMFNSDSASY